MDEVCVWFLNVPASELFNKITQLKYGGIENDLLDWQKYNEKETFSARTTHDLSPHGFICDLDIWKSVQKKHRA